MALDQVSLIQQEERTLLINFCWSHAYGSAPSRFIEVTEPLIPEIEAAFRQIGVMTEWKEFPSPWESLADAEALHEALQVLHVLLGLAYTPGTSMLPCLQAAVKMLLTLQQKNSGLRLLELLEHGWGHLDIIVTEHTILKIHMTKTDI